MSRYFKIATMLVAVCAMILPTACSKKSDPSTINLLVPSYSDNTKGLWQGIIKDFNAKKPDIKINLEVQSWENINSVMQQKIQNDQAPDILNIDSFTAYASDKLLFPAKDVVSAETLDKFPKNFIENASMGGVQYGLPILASARALFYNKDLFQKAGIANPPKTWDELEKDALAIKKLGDFDGYGMPLGNEEAQAETAIWFYGNGGSYGNESKITLDTPKNIEAASFMKKMITEGATQPNAGSSQRTPLGQTFFQGKVGMVIGLPPYIKMISEKNPKLKYGIAPIATKNGSPFTLGVADHLMAFNNDKGAKKDSIKAFLDFFYSDDVYQKFVTTENFIPTTKPVMEKMKSNPGIKDFVAILPDAKFYPLTNPKWKQAQGIIQSDIGQLAKPDINPEKLLKDMQKKVDTQ